MDANLKTKFEAKKTKQWNAFVTDLLNIFLGLISFWCGGGGLETPLTPSGAAAMISAFGSWAVYENNGKCTSFIHGFTGFIAWSDTT